MNPISEGRNMPCKWCGQKTNMLGTKMCDNCFEMDGRVQRSPNVALRMLRSGQPKGSQCIVTGVRLHDVANRRHCHADLFGFGVVYVLECAGWIYEPPEEGCKILTVNDWSKVHIRERRHSGATAVIYTCDAELNEVSQRYLRGEHV
jgi:hypothetical protein